MWLTCSIFTHDISQWEKPPDRHTVLSDRLRGGLTVSLLTHKLRQRVNNRATICSSKCTIFPESCQIGKCGGGRGKAGCRGGGGIRPGLDRSCNLLAGSWERASRHPHLFVRSLPSGRGTLLTHCFTFFILFSLWMRWNSDGCLCIYSLTLM